MNSVHENSLATWRQLNFPCSDRKTGVVSTRWRKFFSIHAEYPPQMLLGLEADADDVSRLDGSDNTPDRGPRSVETLFTVAERRPFWAVEYADVRDGNLCELSLFPVRKGFPQ